MKPVVLVELAIGSTANLNGPKRTEVLHLKKCDCIRIARSLALKTPHRAVWFHRKCNLPFSCSGRSRCGVRCRCRELCCARNGNTCRSKRTPDLNQPQTEPGTNRRRTNFRPTNPFTHTRPQLCLNAPGASNGAGREETGMFPSLCLHAHENSDWKAGFQ